MPYSITDANALLNKILTDHPDMEVAVFTNDPQRTGADELAGSTRAAVTFGAPANGVMANANSGSVGITVSGGPVVITHWGLFDDSANAFVAGYPLGQSYTFNSNGAFTFEADDLIVRM